MNFVFSVKLNLQFNTRNNIGERISRLNNESRTADRDGEDFCTSLKSLLRVNGIRTLTLPDLHIHEHPCFTAFRNVKRFSQDYVATLFLHSLYFLHSNSKFKKEILRLR